MAGNTKHRKDHKKKLQARKTNIEQDKNKMKKMQNEFIMNLIKQEQAKGMFDNTPNINTQIDPTIEGPSF